MAEQKLTDVQLINAARPSASGPGASFFSSNPSDMAVDVDGACSQVMGSLKRAGAAGLSNNNAPKTTFGFSRGNG